MDIVQPDATKVGGISEQIQIARMANEFGVRYIGHGWNTAVGFAADLQLSSAIATADLVEYIGGSPYLDDIKVGGWKVDGEGFVEIPDLPGLGIELDQDALGRFTPDPQHLLKL
jgi:L-alanine-DL-glutamate epimerase-like enolase superfamily enzyme